MDPDADLRAERADAPRPPPERFSAALLVLAAAVVTSVVAAWLWFTATGTRPAAPASQAEAPAAPAASAAPPPAAQALIPVVPVDPLLEPHEIAGALEGLLGSKAAAGFLQTDDFPRRFAATVDSLAREHAASAIWPVLPTPGRFQVEASAEGTVIAPANAARYTPLVLLAGTIDVPAAVHLYRRMYPLLQRAYRELGFGERYLNDRVIEVIDVLLAAPDAPEAARVELLPVKGPVPSLRPWVRYEFVDPRLEALGAGQKIMVRIGPVNQRRLKSKLEELRRELTAPVAPVR
jgi:hypothetical protein